METVVPEAINWLALNANADPTLAATDTLVLTALVIRLHRIKSLQKLPLQIEVTTQQGQPPSWERSFYLLVNVVGETGLGIVPKTNFGVGFVPVRQVDKIHDPILRKRNPLLFVNVLDLGHPFGLLFLGGADFRGIRDQVFSQILQNGFWKYAGESIQQFA